MNHDGKGMSRRVFIRSAAGTVACLLTEPHMFFSAQNASAADEMRLPVGRVLTVKGNARVNDAAMSVGTPLFENDVIQVGKKSTVRVLLDDSVVCQFNAMATARLKRDTPGQTDAFPKGLEIDLSAGGVLTHTRKFPSPGQYRFKITTPAAVAGVRGTTFYVEVMPQNRTYVCACYNEVAMSPANDRTNEKRIKTIEHKAHFIRPGGKTEKEIFKPAPLIHHTDMEILRLKDILKKETGHDSEFEAYTEGDY